MGIITEYESKTFPVGKILDLEGGKAVVLGKDSNKNNRFYIQFIGYKGIKAVFSSALNKGNVKNCEIPTIFGVACIGYGDFLDKRRDSYFYKAYACWHNMLRRVYDEEYKKTKPTYENVSISAEWLNFSNFYIWYKNNYIEGFHLDKDLKSSLFDIKIYSEDTCLFLPERVNYFIRGCRVDNKEGKTGIFFNSYKSLWTTDYIDFESQKRIRKDFKNKEDAYDWHIIQRKIQAEKVKDYMRSLGYYSEEIIQLIK